MICSPEWWAPEVEIVAIRIAAIDSEVPEAISPIDWTIEVCCVEEHVILPVIQHVTQVRVTIVPIVAVEIRLTSDRHQVVEVYLITSLILVFIKIKLIRHLISKEERLLACLLVTHGVRCACDCAKHQCE